MTTPQLSAAQQTQLDNRDATGQWKPKTHGEADNAVDPLGLEEEAGPTRSLNDLLAPRDADADIAEARQAVGELANGDQASKVAYTRAMAKLADTRQGRQEVDADPDYYLHDQAYDGAGFQARDVFESNSRYAQDREHGLAALRAAGVGQNTRPISRDDVDAYPTTALVERFNFRHAGFSDRETLAPELMRVYHHGDDGSIGLRPETGGDLTFINTAGSSTDTGLFNHNASARIDDQSNVISVGNDPGESVEMVLRPVDETPKYSATQTLKAIRNSARGEVKNVHPMSADRLLTPGRRITLHNPLKQNRMPKKTPSKHSGRIVDVTAGSIDIMDDRGDNHRVPRPSMTGRHDKTWTLDRQDRLTTEADHAGSGDRLTWKIEFDDDEPTPDD